MKDPQLTAAQIACNLGIDCEAAGDYQTAITHYDDVIAMLRTKRKLEYTEITAKAMYNRGCAWVSLEKPLDAIATFDALIARFHTNQEPRLGIFVIRAMMNKAYKLMATGAQSEGISAYQEVVLLFADETDPDIALLASSAQSFLNERDQILRAQRSQAQSS